MRIFGKPGRLEIASTQTKPTCVGLKTLFFPRGYLENLGDWKSRLHRQNPPAWV
jgi:hypothetical protein